MQSTKYTNNTNKNKTTMLTFDDIRFDCRLYNGYKPCDYKSQCAGCAHYAPLAGFENCDLSQPAPIAKSTAQALRILIIKTGALGDVLRTTSLLPTLRAAHPDVQIDWVTAKSAVALLKDNPHIDTTYTLDCEEELHALAALSHWTHVLCFEKTDLPIRLMGMLPAQRRFGFAPNAAGLPVAANEAGRYALMLGLDDDLKFYANTKPYTEVICDCAELNYERAPYVLIPNNIANAATHAWKSKLNAPPTIGLNTGCGPVFATKRWPVGAWIALANLLNDKGVNIVLLGGAAEADTNAAIAAACPFVVDTGHTNPLNEFIGIVNACDVVVTADSLAMHIAIALEKRVVAVFGSTSDVEIDLYERGERVVAQADCRPCFKKICPLSTDDIAQCMKQLSPTVVAEAVARQIAALARC